MIKNKQLNKSKKVIDNLRKPKRKIAISLIKYIDPHTAYNDASVPITMEMIRNHKPLIDAVCGVIAFENREIIVLSDNFFDIKDNLKAEGIITSEDEMREDGIVFRDIHTIIKKNIVHREDKDFII